MIGQVCPLQHCVTNPTTDDHRTWSQQVVQLPEAKEQVSWVDEDAPNISPPPPPCKGVPGGPGHVDLPSVLILAGPKVSSHHAAPNTAHHDAGGGIMRYLLLQQQLLVTRKHSFLEADRHHAGQNQVFLQNKKCVFCFCFFMMFTIF